jgi:tetratricopeptide (TPR) repeat protein
VRLQNELAALQRETEHFKQYGTFHEEVKLEMGRTRVMTLVIAGVLVAGAVIAFFSWNKQLDDARQNMEKTNREIANRVFGLERGFFLYQHDFYQDAIPYLKTAYEQYPRDETVIVEYLDSLDREGELDEALAVIQTLRSDPAKFGLYKTGDFFNRVGCILFEKGLTNPAVLDDSFSMFNLSLGAYAPGDGRRMNPLYNLFRYWLVKGDKDQAEAALLQSGWTQKNALSDLIGQKWFAAIANPKSKKIFKIIERDFGKKGTRSDLLSTAGAALKSSGKKK